VKEFFEYNNVILNIPGFEKGKINKIHLNANQNENYIQLKSKNSENLIFKRKIYVDDKNSEYKFYNNNENISYQNELENFKNKKYNDNTSQRLNNNNDKSAILNQKKYEVNGDRNLTNFYNELANKKDIQKLNSKKISFLGMSEKRAKLLFCDNKIGIKYINSNSIDKKANFKHLAEIKEKNARRRNKMNLLNNKNLSSLGIRQNNNDIFTQNDINIHDNNIILHIKKNMIDNKINYNDLKESRNKSTNILDNYENNNIQDNSKQNEKSLIKIHAYSKKENNNTINKIINNNLDLKEIFKKLTSKEKACAILSQSKILQLSERVIFSRATENVRKLIPIKDLMMQNELFLKEKINQIKLNLIMYNKKIESPFIHSKTADISLNIIKKEDEDSFKEVIDNSQNLNENEKKYYHTYICLLYILLGEQMEGINFENINAKILIEKLNKKGYEYMKDYLYLNFIKQHSTLLNEEKRMKIFEEFYSILIEQSEQSEIIKRFKFVIFSYFLIKEIYQYRNNLSKLIDIKNKTKAYFDVLKNKCQL
jgi:hypothetical protein